MIMLNIPYAIIGNSVTKTSLIKKTVPVFAENL